MKPFIAIPAYQTSVPWLIAHQVYRELIHNPTAAGMQIRILEGNPYVGYARDRLAADFLETDCTDLLFIDSDIIFTLEHVNRILSHDVPIVGGVYYKKMVKPEVVCEALPERRLEGNGLLSVKYIGTGFLRINREVFERMIEQYTEEIGYKAEYTDRQEWDFFKTGVYRPTNRWLSEDWYFCQRALDLGYKIFLDTKCRVQHMGVAIYPIQYENTADTDNPAAGNRTNILPTEDTEDCVSTG